MKIPGFTADATLYDSTEIYLIGTLSQSYGNVYPASFDQCIKCLQVAPILCGDNLRCILSSCRGPCRPVLKDEP